MAGGPIFPRSVYLGGAAGRLFPNFHVGAGANSKYDEGIGVGASLASDSVAELRFQMPPTLPTGTCKLKLRALANATSGAAKVNPSWASVAVEEDPSGATLTAEGTGTITWAAGRQQLQLGVGQGVPLVRGGPGVLSGHDLVEVFATRLAGRGAWIPDLGHQAVDV